MTPDTPKPSFSTNFAARLLYGTYRLLMLGAVLWIAWQMLILGGSYPPGKANQINWILAGVAAALLHEFGYLVSGALARFRFLSFTFLGFAVFPLRTRCSWQLVSWEPFPGQCLMFPTDTHDLRRRYLLFFAGGPICGLLLTALAVAGLLRVLSPEPGVNLSLFLQRTAIFGAALSLLSLIPMGVPSRGFCLRVLLRGGQAADQFIATSTLAMLAMAGRRREDMDPGLLAALTLPAPGARWQMLGAQLAYFLALDAGRIEEARAHLAHWSAARSAHAELEAAYFAARHDGDAPAARHHLENALGTFPGGPGGFAPPAARARSEAAVLLAEGRVREARQTLARAARVLPWREHGRDVIRRVVLDGLHALWQEAAWTPAPTGIDGYLDEISSHLTGLPDGKRVEIREELRPHLISLVAAYEEQGRTSEEAVTSALRRFGEPATVARALAMAQPLTGYWPTLRYGLCWFAGAAALFGGMATLSGLLYGPVRSFPPGLFFSLVTAFFVLPAIAGWRMGAAVQEQAGRKAFHALALLMFTGFMLIFPFSFVSDALAGKTMALGMIAMLWMPVGCLAAGLSGARVQRLRRERQEAMKIARR